MNPISNEAYDILDFSTSEGIKATREIKRHVTKRTQHVNKHNTTLQDRRHKRRSGIKLKISTSVSPDKTDALSLHCSLSSAKRFKNLPLPPNIINHASHVPF